MQGKQQDCTIFILKCSKKSVNTIEMNCYCHVIVTHPDIAEIRYIALLVIIRGLVKMCRHSVKYGSFNIGQCPVIATDQRHCRTRRKLENCLEPEH